MDQQQGGQETRALRNVAVAPAEEEYVEAPPLPQQQPPGGGDPFADYKSAAVDMGQKVTEYGSAASENVANFVEESKEKIGGLRSQVADAVEEVGEKSIKDTILDLFSSESLVGKIIFIVFIAILFVVLLRFTLMVISLFYKGNDAPYLISGVLQGNDTQKTIHQNPISDPNSLVTRSNNEASGIEMSWSIWLFLTADDAATAGTKDNYIFTKGDPNSQAAPALIVRTEVSNSAVDGSASKLKKTSLVVQMDTFANNGRDEIIIDNIVLSKWCHVVVRVKNTACDVYINGIVSNRTVLSGVPKQNDSAVVFLPHGGFSGSLSDARYFPYALSSIRINSILFYGPNQNPSVYSTLNAQRNMDRQYLAASWYLS